MLFRKSAHSKEVKAKIKEAKAKTAVKVREIEKLDDPALRLARYETLAATLQGFHANGKPKVMNHESAGIGAFTGAMFGIMIAGMIGGTVLSPPFATAVVLAVVGGGALSGALGGAGLGGILSGRKERKTIRSEYGTIGNARAMYRLGKSVEKKAKKESAIIRATKIREKFNKFSGPASAKTATVAVPAAANKPAQFKS
jgi:hypothetical protein